MTKYLVFPVPDDGLAVVTASHQETAIRKYRKVVPEMSEHELVIVPAAYAQKTNIDIMVPLWKCEIKKI